MKDVKLHNPQAQLYALWRLKQAYEAGEGLEHCPLCTAVRFVCSGCIWALFRKSPKNGGSPCKKFFRGLSIIDFRQDASDRNPHRVKRRLKYADWQIEQVEKYMGETNERNY